MRTFLRNTVCVISVILLFNGELFAQKDLVISGGNAVSSYICSNSQVAVWGDNSGGRLGLGAGFTAASYSTPQLINKSSFGNANIKQVNSGSGAHFVALECGTGNVWSWGENARGQCGVGSVSPVVVTAPARVRASAGIDAAYKETVAGVTYLTNASVVYCGTTSSFAILNNGDLVAWGWNHNVGGNDWEQNAGQLGNGTVTDQFEAVYVNTSAGNRLRNVVQIFAGDAHTMALTNDGTVYSWGSNLHGRLGRHLTAATNDGNQAGGNDSYARPVRYSGNDGSVANQIMTNMIAIQAGDVFGMAIDAKGYVWSWGNGGWNNACGLGNNAGGSAPRKVLKGNTTGASNDGTYLLAKQIGGGQGFGMAIAADGKPVVWGGGGCGDGGGGSSITGHSNGGNASYIQHANSQVHSDVVLINRGDLWGFYGRADGTMWAFGCNANGVLGNGNTTNQGYAVRMDSQLPTNCGLRDFPPEVNLMPKSMTVCKSKFTSQVLNSNFALAGAGIANYRITWYRNGAQVAQNTADNAAIKTYTATTDGTYKVAVEYVGTNSGCEVFESAEDEMTISFFPQQFEAPAGLTYCNNTVTVNVNPKAPYTAANISGKVYNWYPTNISTTALGTTTGTGTATINIGSVTANPGTPPTKTVYVEEIAARTGLIIPKSLKTDAGWQNSETSSLKSSMDGNRYFTGITVLEPVTITELSFMLNTSIQPGNQTADNNKGRAIFTISAYNITLSGGGDKLPGTVISTAGSLALTYERGFPGGNNQVSRVIESVTATGSITLQPGEYFIAVSNVAHTAINGQGLDEIKVYRPSGRQNLIDNLTPNAVTHASNMTANQYNGNQDGLSMFYDIKFRTAQEFCDRIPVTLTEDCPCTQPGNITIISSVATTGTPRTVNLCSGGSTNLTTNNITPTPPFTNFIITWYKGNKTTTVGTPANPGVTANQLRVNYSDVTAAGVTYYVQAVDGDLPNAASCHKWDSVIVKAIPKPVIPPTQIANLCEGKTPDPLPNFVGFGFASHQWYDSSMNPVSSISSTVASTPGTHNYYVAVADSYGCISDTLTVPVVVVASPAPPTINRDVVYYRTDIPFKNLMQQDAGFLTQTPLLDLLWLQEDGVTWNATVPVPPEPGPSDTDDKEYFYKVKQKRVLTPSCESPEVTVTVKIYLIPVPTVSNLSYCFGETASPLTAVINPAGSYTKADYKLTWYDKDENFIKEGLAGEEGNGPVPPTNVAGDHIYYVSQKTTQTESSKVKITVKVYAKPDLQIVTNPNPVCKPDMVNITTVWTVVNEAAIGLSIAGQYYEDDMGATVLSNPAGLAVTGTYYIRAGFTKPENAVNAGNCYSDFKPVIVNIQDLTKPVISGSQTTCEGISVSLTASATSVNPGTITYTWNTGDTGSSFTSSPLNSNTSFTVTATAGTCSSKSDPFDVTIGKGQISGNMSMTENGNTSAPSSIILNEVEFYSCGNEISINANYVSNLNDFKWTRLSDNQVLGYDKALTVKQPQGTEKYELTYTNNCLTSVLLTVHSIPLKVDSLTSKMSLCEGEEFKAQLNIYCAESPDINWYRNGSPVSSGKSPVYTIANATSANSGIYTYTVTNRGCSASGTITASDGKSTLDVSAMPVWNKIPKQTVCEGDSKVVGLYDINPPATQLVWKDDHTIVGPKDQLTATVEPTYNAGNGSGNRSTYKYVIKATNVYCSVEIPIEIDVDEPLNGKIKGADAICEGNPATLDAKSFAASTYSWTSTSFQGSRTTAEITVSPLVTSDYQLTMTRGECSKDMKVTITVNSKPVILLIDSLGPRDREIVPAPGHGTQPLAYGVDNEPVTDDPRKYDLLFAPHTFYIIDAAGCKSKSVEYHVEPPKLFPPAYFTPNGDGYNDTWEIPGMREIYPDATVSIYDRYGKKLVEYKGSADYGWNGRYLGRDMPATDYWYEINIKEINRQYVGHFTLLRR